MTINTAPYFRANWSNGVFQKYSSISNSITYDGSHSVRLNSWQFYIDDTELSNLDSFSGTTLTLVRENGVNSKDQFNLPSQNIEITSEQHVLINGWMWDGSRSQYFNHLDIGTLHNSSGSLNISFNESATKSAVNFFTQQISIFLFQSLLCFPAVPPP